MSGVGSAPFVPTDYSGLFLWLDSTITTDTGNGTQITSVTDRSPTGATVVVGSSNPADGSVGPNRLDPGANRRGVTFMDFANTRCLKTTDATVVGNFNGAPGDRSIVHIYQATSNALSYPWSAGSTSATNRYYGARRGSANYLDQIDSRDPTNNAQYTLGPIEHYTPVVHVTVLDSVAGTATLYIDGVSQGSVAVPRATQTAIDIVCFGCKPTGVAPARNCVERLRHLLKWNRKLTGPEIQGISDWGAEQVGAPGIKLKWKRGFTQSATFGNGSNAWIWFVIAPAQSNGAGRDTITTFTSTYAGTAQAGYILYPDGYLAEAVEPSNDLTDIVGGASADVATPGCSMATRLIDYLRANGETRNIGILNCSIGSTSYTSWTSNLTTSPAPMNSPIGALKHRLTEALKSPNSKIGAFIAYIGETDAGNGTVSGWQAGIGSVFDELNTFFSGKFDKSTHFVLVKHPALAWTLALPGQWAALLAAEDALDAARADTVMVQAPSGNYISGDTQNLHIACGANDTEGQRNLACSVGAAWLAAA